MKALQRRLYQIRAANKAMTSRKKRVLIVSPGGSGKTVIAALIVSKARRSGKKVLLLSHRREIVEQTSATLHGRHRVGIIMEGVKPDATAPVQIASVDTLRGRALPDATVVIVDEAHRAVTHTYTAILKYYESIGARIIGLSATPYRFDGVGLKDRFDIMIEAAKPSQLLGKYIMKPVVYSAPPEHLPNLVGMSATRNDYRQKDLVRRVNKYGLVGGIVKMAKKHLGNRTAVVFCVSIDHSNMVVRKLRRAGYKAAHIDASTKTKDRERILRLVREKKIQIISCCLVLSEGWDLPTCDAVILTRPTRSLALYIQMANRGARMSKRRPLILDHACNTVTHGFSWIDREWSLDGTSIVKARQPAAAKVCPGCGYVGPTTAKRCANCGFQFPIKRSPAERKQLELVEWSEREKKRRRQLIEDFAKNHNLPKRWVNETYRMWAVENA